MRNALGLVLLCTLAVVSEASEFEFVVIYDGDRMSVDCREGCSIPIIPSRLSPRQQCLPNRCSVTVRDDSLNIGDGPSDGSTFFLASSAQDSPFEVHLFPADAAVNADCSTGCSWQRDSFECPAMPCVATIDEIGIRLGDVAGPRRDPVEGGASNRDPFQGWVDCLVASIITIKLKGEPVSFATARDEARAACLEHGAGWDEFVKESGLSTVELEEGLDELLRTAWEVELHEAQP